MTYKMKRISSSELESEAELLSLFNRIASEDFKLSVLIGATRELTYFCIYAKPLSTD